MSCIAATPAGTYDGGNTPESTSLYRCSSKRTSSTIFEQASSSGLCSTLLKSAVECTVLRSVLLAKSRRRAIAASPSARSSEAAVRRRDRAPPARCWRMHSESHVAARCAHPAA
eukprot:CAMPEP_0198720840 /NCGR_PEP_ID=MMETSP1471-20131121/64386_1 /TAXON_ID=41880 /ORGANISM="Pycnococcus provasolii, Strain RCC733" /LENGTH=113 /DNA_ID=CAMNT_0044481707 /DNA_START=259 /DNA_END=600 /DNA_ORIENTATION=-